MNFVFPLPFKRHYMREMTRGNIVVKFRSHIYMTGDVLLYNITSKPLYYIVHTLFRTTKNVYTTGITNQCSHLDVR